MIGPILTFVQDFIKDHGCPKEILEVGSRNVNGAVKQFFIDSSSYIGVDLEAGDGVDITMDAENLLERFSPESFNAVICLETLEHTKNPLKIVDNMRKILRPGGWMIISTPGTEHPQHNWPQDYYRFFESTYQDVFFEGFINCSFHTLIWPSSLVSQPNTLYPCAVMGYGQKP
jgi:SAM-dependent methyltransferase